MDAAQVAGWLLVAGSVTFGIGAGDPYLVRAWTAPRATLSALLVGGLLLTGDMPPFTVYLAPLAFGIALLLGA